MNYKNKSCKTKKKAFTLIELLIVIAIIGILFIVLVSKVDFATDKAKTTGVQTDFRSFQVAFETVSRENAGFNTLGWDTGDIKRSDFATALPGYTYTNEAKDAGDRVRNSYDVGDLNLNNKLDNGETWTGRKIYTENWTSIYTLDNPGDAADKSAYILLEEAINKNLDPKLHITIDPDAKTFSMKNGYQDPWKTEYHGFYLSNAAIDGQDRGAILMYSNGPNKTFGSEQTIANGAVTINIPGNNIQGQDDLSILSIYTYFNGYGENKTTTTGFSKNQTFFSGPGGTNPSVTEELMECGHVKNTPGNHTKRDCGHYNCGPACTCEVVPCGIAGHRIGDGLDHSSKHGDHFRCQCVGWVVPEGCTYYVGVTNKTLGNYTGATTIYNAGDTIPCGTTPNKGDVFTSKDYEYRYYYEYNIYSNEWYTNGAAYSWCVRVLDNTKTAYEPILESINNTPVVSLEYTFAQCTSLIASPKIPSTIKSMLGTFKDCTNLIEAPTIPYGVTIMSGAFKKCNSLVDLGDFIIPNSVQYMDSAFYNCKSLVTAPIIPNSVTNLAWTFSGCTSLEGTVYINTNNIVSSAQSTASGNGGACFRYIDMNKITLAGEASKDVLNLLGNTGNNWTKIE